jgi:hypothetical protein
MNNSFFLFHGALMAQPLIDPSRMAGPRSQNEALSQKLASSALPAGRVRESDIPRIQSTIEKALKKISDSLKSTGPDGSNADLDTVKSGILAFMDWLNRQGCVSKAGTTYDVEATDTYAESIFAVYPGQLPFDIVFNMQGDVNPQYRLLIFVSRLDFLSFGNLMKNTSLAGIPVPENWPGGYLSKRP